VIVAVVEMDAVEVGRVMTAVGAAVQDQGRSVDLWRGEIGTRQ
jgi:hypothetical protein